MDTVTITVVEEVVEIVSVIEKGDKGDKGDPGGAIPELSQAQVEDESSTVFGSVSGLRLFQSILSFISSARAYISKGSFEPIFANGIVTGTYAFDYDDGNISLFCSLYEIRPNLQFHQQADCRADIVEGSAYYAGKIKGEVKDRMIFTKQSGCPCKAGIGSCA